MSNKFEQIKNKYISTFAKKHSDLKAAWGNRDVAELHNLLHKLTGSSGSFGFVQISDLCQQSIKLIIDDQNIIDVPLFEQNLKKISELLQYEWHKT